MPLYRKVTVGIFSRESQESYRWLINLLLSRPFRTAVRDVRPVTLTNTVCGHSDQLAREISMCSFAILYHTKKRGRLNITDVTDSLYDEELRHLSARLGRERVIVLVDDVDTDDSEVYRSIVTDQPLIPRLSGLLIVMCIDGKSLYEHSDGDGTSGRGSYQQNSTVRSMEKIEKIRSQIRKAKELNVPLVLLIGFFVIVIIVVVVTVSIEERK